MLQAIRAGWRDCNVCNYDPQCALDLRVVTFGHDGPGARRAAEIKPDREVAITEPEGRLISRSTAPYHLLVDEETASVTLGAIARSVPESERILGVVEVDTPAGRPALPRSTS
ncbi:hypothetical protein [Umezawaea sp. Da 62-37]|uniref:hypothetical protein n=1 Tax=Umezawaea sp. Da 62-37 TaxID=3075927 RepID=UPI0028F6D84E|nr:hypothetical protein [Umezawaea sp. Da 62-37]WNV87707.1 hypothetical protein RM788_05295 [Umezawaea sp. Da 62-37]